MLKDTEFKQEYLHVNDVGDLVFDTNAQKLKSLMEIVPVGGSSVNGTSERFIYTATANQTTFSGADDNGDTLLMMLQWNFFADVYLNGVKLAPADFTATNGTSIILVGLRLMIFYKWLAMVHLPCFTVHQTLHQEHYQWQITFTNINSKGDGSSTDGAIQLNCSQNSQGVKN